MTVRLCVVDKGRNSACIHVLLDDTGNTHVSTLGNIHALLYILKQLCLIKLERKTHTRTGFLGERVGAAYRERVNWTSLD